MRSTMTPTGYHPYAPTGRVLACARAWVFGERLDHTNPTAHLIID